MIVRPLNAHQLNNIAGGGQTGEKKEGESFKRLAVIRGAFADVSPRLSRRTR
jgi:hypothetical protein